MQSTNKHDVSPQNDDRRFNTLHDTTSKLRDYLSMHNDNFDNIDIKKLVSELEVNIYTSVLETQHEWDKATAAAAQYLLDHIPKYSDVPDNNYIESLADTFNIDLKTLYSPESLTQDTICKIITDIKQKFKENEHIRWFLLLLSNPTSSITHMTFDFDENSTILKPSDSENTVDYAKSITIGINKDYKCISRDSDTSYIKEITEKNIDNTFDEISNAALLNILLDTTKLLSNALDKKTIKSDKFKFLPEVFSVNNLIFYDKIYDLNKSSAFSNYLKNKRYPIILAPWFFYVFHRTETKSTIDDDHLWSINTNDYKDTILPCLAYFKKKGKEDCARHLVIDLKKYIQHLYNTNDQVINKSLCLHLLNLKTTLVSTLILSMYTDGNEIKSILRRNYSHLGKNKLRKIPDSEYQKIKEKFYKDATEVEINNRLCMANFISPGLAFNFLGNKNRDYYLYTHETASAITLIQKAMSDLIRFGLFEQPNKNNFDNIYSIYTYLKNFDPYCGDSGLLKKLLNKLNSHEKFPLDKFIYSYEHLGEMFKKTRKMKNANMWF